MASPIPPVPPPPVVVVPRRRSLSGPLVLIVIGVFFLLLTSHVIDRATLHHWFAHWWPVLLIFWGVIRLIEYYSDQQHGYPARRMGGGGIFLLIIFVLIGLSVTKTENVNWNGIRDNIQVGDDDWDSWFGGQTFTFTNEMQQSLPANNASLRVLNDNGDVVINVWDQNSIKVASNKKIRADEGSDGNKLDSQTRPNITAEGNVVVVNANTAGAGGNVRTRNDLQIWVPASLPVDIATRRGDVTVRERNANVKVGNSKGSITVEDVKGNVDLDERSKGDIHLARITGDVSVSGQVEDSSIAEVSGDVKLTGDYFGDMQLSKLAKGFSFRSSRTDLELAKLDGDLNFNPGDLRGNNITGPVKVLTKSTDIHLDGLSGEVHVENSNGEVDVHSNKLGAIDITNQSGDVHVTLPPKAAFQADLRTRNGDVQSDFGGLKIDTQNGGSTATGSVGSGGPTVKVNNEHGNVEIRKGGPDEG